MRHLIATLVLLNLLILIWNLIYPFQSPLSKPYRVSPELIELELVAATVISSNEEGGAPPVSSKPAIRTSPPPERVRARNESAESDVDAATDLDTTSEGLKVFVCGSLGPMLSAEEQTNVLSRLSLETNAILSPRVEKNRRNVSYWALIPPLASLTDARDTMRKLVQNGLNESFIVTEEEYRNAISLGVFLDQSKAQRLVERVRSMDMEAKPEIIVRGRHNYWIDFESEINSEYYRAIGDLLNQKNHLRHLEDECR